MNRKPEFILWDGLGPCVVYPVSVHVCGRTWMDKNILVPVKAWLNGKRAFGYFEGHGVSLPEYTVSGKVEQSLTRAVVDCKRLFAVKSEICQLVDNIRELEDLMHFMGEAYCFTYYSSLKGRN